jgi:hypothetical protein
MNLFKSSEIVLDSQLGSENRQKNTPVWITKFFEFCFDYQTGGIKHESSKIAFGIRAF